MKAATGARTAVLLAIALLGAWSIATLRFETELLPLFPRHLESVKALQKALDAGEQDRSIFIIPQESSTDLSTLAGRLAQSPEVASVEYPALPVNILRGALVERAVRLPPDRFTELVEKFGPRRLAEEVSGISEKLSGVLDERDIFLLRVDPLGLGPLVFRKEGPQEHPRRILSVQARSPLKTFGECQAFVQMIRSTADTLHPRPDVLLTGRAVFTAEISRQMQRDTFIMLGATFFLICLAFWLFYRSVLPLLCIAGLQIAALLCGLIAARFVFGSLNVISMAFASILLGVGMDYSILTYHHFSSSHPVSSEWLRLRRGIWLSACTTAAAFGILLFSRFPGLQQLALLVATGLLATAAFATAILPSVLERLRPAQPVSLERSAVAAAGFFTRHRNALRGVLLAGWAAAIGFLWMKHSHPFFDGDLEKLRPTQIEAYRGQELLNPGGPQKTLPGENRSLWVSGRAPEVERVFQEAGFDESWSGPVVEFTQMIDAWSEGLGAGPWERLKIELTRASLSDLTRLSAVMGLVVLALCWAAHRSARLVLLNFAALLFACTMLASLLVLSRASMTVISLLCLPLLIGLVIDYSIHLLLALEAHEGDFRATFRHLAAPVLLTGLTSLIGCGAPMLSGQPALQNFGLVMDFGVLSAVLAGLLFLPLFYFRGKKRSHVSKSLYHAAGFELGLNIARVTPRFFLQAVGSVAGRCYALTHPAKTKVVGRNLRLLSPPRLVKPAEVYASFGRTLADYFHAGTLDLATAAALIEDRLGYDHLKKAHDDGKGCLLLTAHLGFFELGGLLGTELGFPTVILTLPEPSESLSRWRADYRARWGVGTVEIGLDQFAFLEALRHLKEGKFLAALFDRPHASQSAVVQLPGGPILVSPGAFLLAHIADCPVIPVTITRKTNGRYRMEAHAPIPPERQRPGPETLQRCAQRAFDCILPTIREYPEQWFQFVPLSPSF